MQVKAGKDFLEDAKSLVFPERLPYAILFFDPNSNKNQIAWFGDPEQSLKLDLLKAALMSIINKT